MILNRNERYGLRKALYVYNHTPLRKCWIDYVEDWGDYTGTVKMSFKVKAEGYDMSPEEAESFAEQIISTASIVKLLNSFNIKVIMGKEADENVDEAKRSHNNWTELLNNK